MGHRFSCSICNQVGREQMSYSLGVPVCVPCPEPNAGLTPELLDKCMLGFALEQMETFSEHNRATASSTHVLNTSSKTISMWGTVSPVCELLLDCWLLSSSLLARWLLLSWSRRDKLLGMFRSWEEPSKWLESQSAGMLVCVTPVRKAVRVLTPYKVFTGRRFARQRPYPLGWRAVR